MIVSLNADEIKSIIADYFSISEDDVRVGTIEIKKNMRIDYEPSATIKKLWYKRSKCNKEMRLSLEELWYS